MIEGLKVTVLGSELQSLCRSRAEYHLERCKVYLEQIGTMEANRLEGMNYTNGDPVQAIKDRNCVHRNEAAELLFIAGHLVAGESYLLASSDLQKLGITKSRY